MNKKFQVQSKSKKEIYYLVQEIDNELICNCPAGSRDMNCNHKDVINKFLNRQSQKFEDLERIKAL